MPRVRATIWLPYRLKLQEGSYPTGPEGLTLEVADGRAQNTAVSLTRDQSDTGDPAEQSRLNGRHADQLLNLTNRLLRCYRAITRDATTTDLSREQVRRFEFRVVSEGASVSFWEGEVIFEIAARAPTRLTPVRRSKSRDGSRRS